MMVIKIFRAVCQVIFNLTILQSHTFSFGKFLQTMVYYAVNVPRHQEPQKYDMVWELATFNLTWCDKIKCVVVRLLMVAMHSKNGKYQNS